MDSLKQGWLLVVALVRFLIRDAISGKMALFVGAVERQLTAEDIDTHLEGCVGCGACANACNWATGTNRADLHPKARADFLRRIYTRFLTVKGIVMGRLGLLPTPTDDDLKAQGEAMFSSCTMCGRCARACSQGVSNRRLTQLIRIGLTASGFMPPVIAKIRNDAAMTRHSFGLSFEASVGKMLKAGQDRGVEIPVDRHGARWLTVCSAILNARAPEMFIDAAALLNQAKISYTVSSILKDTGTEVFTTVCDPELGRRFVRELCEEAKRLGCTGIMIGECGCDMRTYHIDASDIMREFSLEVAYIDALILEAAKAGKIPLARLPGTYTYHDPCWTARLTGYTETARQLLRLCVEEFVDLTPNRHDQICCNGGGGQMRAHPADKTEGNLRRQVSSLKAAQIRASGAANVSTPCTTCYFSIADTLKSFGLQSVRASMVAAVVYESMTLAMSRQQEERKAANV